MNVKASCLYQIRENKRAIVIYYFVITCVALVSFLDSAVQINGVDLSTAIFLFVVGLCSFKENFCMLMQNSVSRKSIFKGRLFTTVCISLGMAILDRIFQIIFNLFFSSNGFQYIDSMYEQIYNSKLGSMNFFQITLGSFLLDFSIYLSLFMTGYLITILFYRLGKNGKIAVSVLVPVTSGVILPLLDTRFFHGKISMVMEGFVDVAFGIREVRPQNAMMTCLIIFAFTALISWLLMRKAAVRV